MSHLRVNYNERTYILITNGPVKQFLFEPQNGIKIKNCSGCVKYLYNRP